MTPSAITLEGTGLRSGRPARLTLQRRAGPFSVSSGASDVDLATLVVENADRATTVRSDTFVIAMVEHLFGAAAGLGLHEGIAVEVDGGEVPLLDGAGLVLADALLSLAVPASEPSLTVLRDATLVSGESRYTFERAAQSTLAVTLAFDDARIAAEAGWDGTPRDFLERIAPARTFTFAHELEGLVLRGQASHVDPASVVVLTPTEVLCAGRPFASDEPARHKLLDLMGDLFLHGGPPRGHVHAFRPGHRATHTILRRALAEGVVA